MPRVSRTNSTNGTHPDTTPSTTPPKCNDGHALLKLIEREIKAKSTNNDKILEEISIICNQPNGADIISTYFYDLIYETCSQEIISPKRVGTVCCEILHLLFKLDQNYLISFVDVLVIILARIVRTKDLEQLRGDSATRRKLYEANPKLKRILEYIQSLTVIPQDLLRLRLDPEILYVTRLTQLSPVNFNRRYNQIRTSLYYKQKRFNLAREESEGFSKLITELSLFLDDDFYQVQNAVDSIKSLIGCFRLDGNKVLNCILIAVEHTTCPEEQSKLVEFLKLYIKDADDGSTPGNLIAFRLENTKAHDAEKTTLQRCSETFFRMIALLIKEKVVTIDQIWPKMKPDDDKICTVYNDSLEQSVKNASKTKVSLGEVDEEAKKAKEKENLTSITMNYRIPNFQKIRLVPYLFNFGLYELAFNLIQTFPEYCLVSYLPLRISMFKFIEKNLEKYHEKSLTTITKLITGKNTEKSELDDSMDDESDKDFLFNVVFKAVNALGPYMSEQAILLTKVLRVADFYEDDVQIFNMLQKTMLPSLNLMEGNCGFSNEIWKVLQKYPFQVRFEVYKTWLHEDTWRAHATLAAAKTQMAARTRYLLKRLTKENVKQYGRQLGKIAHSNPGVLFGIFVSQLQRYDNLIDPIVDSIRYLTPLSFDTLAFCLGEELQDESKDRLQPDGASIAQWLQAMAKFCGKVYKRHAMELGGILLHIANQLKSGKSMFELLLLQDVIGKMTGMEADSSFEPTPQQLEALMGGELLRTEGGFFGHNIKASQALKKSSLKLRDALKTQKLETALILMIALQRDRVLFGETADKMGGALDVLKSSGASPEEQARIHGAKLKLQGDMIDMCHSVMYQLGTFMTSKEIMGSFKFLPVNELIKEYHSPVDVAFFIGRKHIKESIYTNLRKRYALAVDQKNKALAGVELFKKTEAENAKKRESGEENAPEITSEEEKTKIIEEYKKKIQIDRAGLYCASSDEVMADIREKIVDCCPGNLWSDVTPEFYTTFWSLENYDMKVPVNAYNRTIASINEQIVDLEKDFDERSRNKNKILREKERLQARADQIRDEQKRHLKHVQMLNRRLLNESKLWIKKSKGDIITKLLQNFIFKRAVFSAEDAIYCANFILKMHEMQTPNFQTLLFFDRLFTDISYLVGSLTEQQAMNYGRFLSRLLEEKIMWHSSKEKYDVHCGAHPGFVTVLRQGSADGTKEQVAVQLDYENYRHVCNKWQYKLVKASITCLDSTDFVQQRNILVILPRLLPFFPRIENQANTLLKGIKKFFENETRQDLKVKAMALQGAFKKHEKHVVPVDKFHVVTKKAAAAAKEETEKNKAEEEEKKKAKKDSSKSRDPSVKRGESEAREKSKSRSRHDRDENSQEREASHPSKRARNDNAAVDKALPDKKDRKHREGRDDEERRARKRDKSER